MLTKRLNQARQIALLDGLKYRSMFCLFLLDSLGPAFATVMNARDLDVSIQPPVNLDQFAIARELND